MEKNICSYVTFAVQFRNAAESFLCSWLAIHIPKVTAHFKGRTPSGSYCAESMSVRLLILY